MLELSRSVVADKQRQRGVETIGKRTREREGLRLKAVEIRK